MNAYGVVNSTLALTSAPDRGKWLASHFGRFTRVGRVSLESAYSGAFLQLPRLDYPFSVVQPAPWPEY